MSDITPEQITFGPGLYFDIQKVLDKALGTEEADGAGAGIVADVALVAERMQAAEAEVGRLRAEAKRDEESTGRLIDERDNFHALLDRFAYTVAPMEEIGEHSSGNDPWVNALDMVTPAAEVSRLRAAVDLLGSQLQGGAQAAKDLARVIDVVVLEIRRAVRLANAGDLAAAMEVVIDFASEADWLDNLDEDDRFDRLSAPTVEQQGGSK